MAVVFLSLPVCASSAAALSGMQGVSLQVQKKSKKALESSAGAVGAVKRARGSSSPAGEMEAVNKRTLHFLLEKIFFPLENNS